MTMSRPAPLASTGIRENAPLLIIALAAAGGVAGLVTWVHWIATGDAAWVNAFFRYPNAVFTVVVCLLEAGFCFEAWRQFEPGDALRPAWFWLLLASLAHFTGRVLGLPGSETVAATQLVSMKELGEVIGGPIQMSLLFAGLANVAVHCRKLGILRRLTRIDYALLLLLAALTVRTTIGISAYTSAGKPVTWVVAVLWTSDPLLLLLLAVSVALHRSAANLGHGMIANCWRSFVVAIVLTSLGSASTWCLDCTVTPIWTSLGWYVWLFADAAFALGPAFQLAALERARVGVRF